METRQLSRQQLLIGEEDDIVLVRQQVRTLAQRRGFDPFATAAITTASSELARNVWSHAGKGQAIIEELGLEGRFGIRIEFRDEGPGIADLPRALAGGFSTARSLGLGLSGSRRLVDEFEIQSELGRGTTVTIAKWKRF